MPCFAIRRQAPRRRQPHRDPYLFVVSKTFLRRRRRSLSPSHRYRFRKVEYKEDALEYELTPGCFVEDLGNVKLPVNVPAPVVKKKMSTKTDKRTVPRLHKFTKQKLAEISDPNDDPRRFVIYKSVLRETKAVVREAKYWKDKLNPNLNPGSIIRWAKFKAVIDGSGTLEKPIEESILVTVHCQCNESYCSFCQDSICE